MVPTLITGSTAEERQKKSYELAAKSMGISPDRLESQPDFFLITPGPSITIAQTRTLISRLSRKPFQSPVSVAVLLGANLATVDAQNALLKTLEEPFPSSYIILTSPNKDLLLPTVVSRCREISLKFQGKPQVDNPDYTMTVDLVSFFLENVPEKRLEKLDQITLGKQETLAVLENFTKAAEEFLVKTKDTEKQKKLASFVRHADQARKYVSANANIRLALANFLLSF